MLNAVFNVVSDFWILIMPFPQLLKLQLRVRQKIGLIIVFAAGLACAHPPPFLLLPLYLAVLDSSNPIAVHVHPVWPGWLSSESIMRTPMFFGYKPSTLSSRSYPSLSTWCLQNTWLQTVSTDHSYRRIVEMNVGIIVACVSTFPICFTNLKMYILSATTSLRSLLASSSAEKDSEPRTADFPKDSFLQTHESTNSVWKVPFQGWYAEAHGVAIHQWLHSWLVSTGGKMRAESFARANVIDCERILVQRVWLNQWTKSENLLWWRGGLLICHDIAPAYLVLPLYSTRWWDRQSAVESPPVRRKVISWAGSKWPGMTELLRYQTV